jgi:hypothetical protein
MPEAIIRDGKTRAPKNTEIGNCDSSTLYHEVSLCTGPKGWIPCIAEKDESRPNCWSSKLEDLAVEFGVGHELFEILVVQIVE